MTYDVFISYAHSDTEPVQAIAAALRERGLQIWIDEQEIEDFASITRSIQEGLAQSKTLLVYYSQSYPTRRPCQWELTAALIVARNAGEPTDRILVVNPEGTTKHIQPVPLRDALFRTAPNDEAQLLTLVESVAEKVGPIRNTLGEVHPLIPSWHGTHPLGSPRFVGRVTEMWDLHSKLHGRETAIITGQSGAGTAQVRGLGGIGKSLLAEEYALRFGAAYPGGVFWVRAYGNDDAKAGLSTEDRQAERNGQVNRFAEELGIDTVDKTPSQVWGEVGAPRPGEKTVSVGVWSTTCPPTSHAKRRRRGSPRTRLR